MDLQEIALNIEQTENGIFKSRSASPISYPEEGNEHCMQIEEDSFWFAHRNNVIAECVRQLNGDRVFFDIGGGNGFVSKRLQDEGHQVVLVEPGPAGAMNGRSRGIAQVVCSTLEDARFVANSVESVGLFDVVEHIEDDHNFMKSIHHHMKEDGLVYISVPAYRFLWSDEDDDAGHFRRYTLKTMTSLLEGVGFELVYSTYIFSVLPVPIFLFRSLPSRLSKNRNSHSLEKHQSEHRAPGGLMQRMMSGVWNWEMSRIEKRKRIGFGGSCFVVARKTDFK